MEETLREGVRVLGSMGGGGGETVRNRHKNYSRTNTYALTNMRWTESRIIYGIVSR